MDYWIALFGILYFVVLLQVIYFLSPQTRRIQRVDPKYESNLHYVIICRQIMLFLSPFFIVYYFWRQSLALEFFVGLIALGLTINIFWVVQVPQLTKANLYIDFSVDCINKFKPKLWLKPDTEYTIYTRVYNLGFHTLKNALVLKYFKKGFEVIPDGEKYEDVDFHKEFSVQKCNYGASFPPNKNYQTIPPQEWFIFH